MAYRVIWSSKAVEDVDAIATYIARDSPSYAAAVVRRILDTTHQLKEDPMTGKVPPEFTEESVREKNAYTYRIIYQIQDERVIVAAIVHTKALIVMEV
ncbi:type II toxin-antitoxin system mRNA interferase toxin, RelE/StbE family [Aphanothece hegewaldii CCALA 016]|uniref:Type II toxin-antitoxin system mRNA interferase toxin, RelE/StbE family n=1 Tax=Aphanothece hegewaldii CCALA 016 TaxID=2107694 RepID=A0A2T1M2J2_9CHRO|nr:type II toxin-antitoxin system RelE/ParE family toxin [Aphanothece hegewaldii]PSF38960.1 type II toxin-antitoxin system mRNA interferase toxin, RelE/StbE family [Aphanothece hegewaldii CCALA 016]